MHSFETNLCQAWVWWLQQEPKPLIPTLKQVQEFHQRLFHDDPSVAPGQLKNAPNFIQLPGGFLHLCAPEEVEQSYAVLRDQMETLLDKFTDEGTATMSHEQQLRRAEFMAFYHASFIQIHPFRDGNGRLSRLIALGQRMILFPDFDPQITPPLAASDPHLYNGFNATTYRTYLDCAHERLCYLMDYFLPPLGEARATIPFPSEPPFKIPRVESSRPPSSAPQSARSPTRRAP